ncbi:hypothetical protein [Microtetraspora malaysiensis]|uniref:Uncharacterized protein n=1 Tax=Microtetraspora malaysiensis TaxID=161358 RepID=A0ABW6SXY0_9ACTN
MLANLLPGIREIRAPLAAGYLWLAVVWLQWGIGLPHPGQAQGVLAEVYRMGEAAGPAPVGVAVSFVAYLVGALSVSLTTRALVIGEHDRFSRAFRREVANMIGDVARGEGVTRPGPSKELTDVVVNAARRDLALLPGRLLGKESEIYNAWDRVNGEAEFRAAVAPPLVCVGLVLQEVSVYLPIVLGFAGCALFLNAAGRRSQANLILIQAVRASRVDVVPPRLLVVEGEEELADRARREQHREQHRERPPERDYSKARPIDGQLLASLGYSVSATTEQEVPRERG